LRKRLAPTTHALNDLCDLLGIRVIEPGWEGEVGDVNGAANDNNIEEARVQKKNVNRVGSGGRGGGGDDPSSTRATPPHLRRAKTSPGPQTPGWVISHGG
jgi:hypothetical protein